MKYGSSLSLGDQGWMQIANFLVCGLLTLCFAVGLRQVLHTGRGSVWGPILLGVFSVALIVAGLFVTDPNLGYPPGTHSSGPQTLHGTIHGVAGLIAFSSVTIASFVMARRFAGDPNWKGWALYSIVTGVLVAVFFKVFWQRLLFSAKRGMLFARKVYGNDLGIFGPFLPMKGP